MLIGTAICIWAEYYTNYLPQIAELLGGGGALIWISAAFGILKSERTDEVKQWIERTVFSSSRFSYCLMAVAVGLAWAATQFGSVQINLQTEQPERSVQIRKINTKSDDWQTLKAAEPLRVLVHTSWWKPAQIVIKVKGYPEKTASAKPLQRVSLNVPDSIRSQVILLRPQLPVSDAATPPAGSAAPVDDIQLEWKDSNGANILYSAPFDGHSVLVGGDTDIALPSEFEESWRAEAGPRKFDALALWKYPEAPEAFALSLAPDQEITVRVCPAKSCPTNALLSQQFFVSPARGSVPFVQEVVLRYAKSQ